MSFRVSHLRLLFGLLFGGLALSALAEESAIARLKKLSLEELLNLQVSTVSRTDEKWWDVPSGVDVVTGEDIRRAGVLNLPDALRLATGVHVGQSSARSWAISLRGMNVLAANKVAVMMDGRSLFTPFFSGVQWDAQDTLLEDIDRIEVVRGPVGSLWGAYAVNGLVQILTKSAQDTQGLLASAGAGTELPRFASFRYGGRWGEAAYYRVYAKYTEFNWSYNAAGQRTQPAEGFIQTGFRSDGATGTHTWTVQGDYYSNQNLPHGQAQVDIDGFNVLGRWTGELPSGRIEASSYIDHTHRLIPAQFEETRGTWSGSLKFERRGVRHDLLLGADALISRDRIGNFGFAKLEPPRTTTHVAGAFAQDVLHLSAAHELTAAVKLEHNSFSGFEYQPSLRHAWTINDATMAWAAISRAVRTPVRVDQNLVLEFAGTKLFQATDAFDTEIAYAAEIGLRHRWGSKATADVSLFHYDYDRIRSTETLGATPLPRTFGNRLNAESLGGEVTVQWQPAAPVLFKASYRYLDLDFARDAGSIDTSGGNAEGNDPRHVATLGAHLDLPRGWEVDAFIRHASSLPNPALPGYVVGDLRLGWRSAAWEISLMARNLGDRQFPEFITTNSLNEEVRRQYLAKVTWRY